MTAAPDAEREVLVGEIGPRDDAPAREPTHVRGTPDEQGSDELGDVDLVPTQRPERIGRVENVEAVDETAEIGGAPPVVWVPDEGQLTAAVEPADEEGAVADRPAGVRIVDSVAPHLRDVLAGERVVGQDRVEELPPATDRLPKHDPKRLRVECLEAPDLPVELSGAGIAVSGVRPVGEAKVCGADGHAVVPPCLRADVIGERERIPADRCPRDEVRPKATP
jgi:hypothetical protein